MDLIDRPYLKEFWSSLEAWGDQRMVTREELFALATFNMYIVNLAEEDGWVYCGHSYKAGLVMGTLVVKAYQDELPVVVFTSARSPTRCMIVFLRKLEAGVLEWREDKYRT